MSMLKTVDGQEDQEPKSRVAPKGNMKGNEGN